MTQSSWKDQLELHLESWRNAGIDFLPVLPAASMPLPPPHSGTSAGNQLSANQAPGRKSLGTGHTLTLPEQGRPPMAPPDTLFEANESPPPRWAKPPESFPAPKPVTQDGPPILGLPVISVPIRERMLKDLSVKVAQCRSCPELVRNRSRTVFGIGPVDVELAIIGEAPGFNEDQQGEPFVGPAGQLLDRMLAACGFRREDVFICNILRCRPPENRPPMPDEAANCRPFLVQTLELIRPKHLCLMGASAAKYLLQVEQTIGMLRGKELSWRGIPATATYHPSYLLRTPAKKADAWQDLQEMIKRMGRSLPNKESS